MFGNASFMGIIDIFLVPILIASFIYIIQLIKTISDNEKNKKDLITINENLKKTNSNLENKIEENRKLTKHYGEQTLLTITKEKNIQRELLKLIPSDKSSFALSLLSESIKEIHTVIEETKAINISQNLNIDTSSLEQICPDCKISMQDYGYGPTPHGYIWHYKCPKCGKILQGGSFDDIWDE